MLQGVVGGNKAFKIIGGLLNVVGEKKLFAFGKSWSIVGRSRWIANILKTIGRLQVVVDGNWGGLVSIILNLHVL